MLGKQKVEEGGQAVSRDLRPQSQQEAGNVFQITFQFLLGCASQLRFWEISSNAIDNPRVLTCVGFNGCLFHTNIWPLSRLRFLILEELPS